MLRVKGMCVKVIQRFLILLVMSLSLASPAFAALPGLPGSGDKSEQKISDAQLEQSLNQVIQVLENDKQRADMLKKLKQLRDVTEKNKQESGGVLGLLGETIGSFERQFQGENSPLVLWTKKLEKTQEELVARAPSWQQWPEMVLDFAMVILIWGCVAVGLRWLARRMQQRFGLEQELPQNPKTRDLMLFAVRKLGPWLIAFLITLYFAVALPSSLGRMLAMITAYVLVCGTLISALCVISLSLISGPHRTPALNILRRKAFRPLWLIGSLATLGEVVHDPRVVEGLGVYTSLSIASVANILAATLTAIFALKFRRPIAHLIRNQPLQRRLKQRGVQELIEVVGSLWYVPVLLLVGTSLVATVMTAGDSSATLRRALLCSVIAVVWLTVNGLIRRAHTRPPRAGHRQSAPYVEQLKKFFYTLVHLGTVLVFLEIGLRVWGMSLLSYAEGEGSAISIKVVSFATTLIFAWLAWILADTAIQHVLGLGAKNRTSTRALTMLPLIRNVIFVTIAIIALIVALANMGMNVTPLLAGAGVIGLAIGFGAQSLVADLITGLFIIIEDSLSIDDYVDVGGHLGTVEALTIRTVRLRDLDGVVHTVPFSEIKTIKNYSRQFGYAMFRWPVPATMPINDALALVREVAGELRNDRVVSRNIWSPLEMQGVESFDNGQAILRFRFKTAPIKQWEVQRAFNLLLRQKLDARGLELAMPRLNVQLTRPRAATAGAPDEEA
ncbi:mechanosensitive ion channel family protein [Pseudomonas sp. TTU2014-080ASC]|uniref:mechanosensitive ion channel family protein n=1 Tax=Pseudomonas sp. TTU2014-080ASC TaxID=1729724 RepID=UPI00128F1155|nr:mechanosensitive ion channel domain-containing protein [Pseudomonas sp. TTU2014-080ASC]